MDDTTNAIGQRADDEQRPGAADYLPAVAARRSGIALCLSGGGFRAALFHLGALRRLNELGLLSSVDEISSVSGGSIIAAHLADRLRAWPEAGAVVLDWEERVARPFRHFARRNLRTAPIVKRLLPWNWPRSDTAVKALAARYESRLTRLSLRELPQRPRFILCATDMPFGCNWEFTRGYVGDYQAGYLRPAPAWPLARAVAASSCFPPVFDPLEAGLRPDQLVGGKASGPTRDELVRNLRLTDGGVYDNMGLEPVWKRAAVVLVSDGGGVFDYESDSNVIMRSLRYGTIIGNQARAVRKRWLIAGFIEGTMRGTYWGIGSDTARYGRGDGYSAELVDGVIRTVRTDMDAFTEAEVAVLENHGYTLADAAIQRHLPDVARPSAGDPAVPHPEWMVESRVRQALRESHKRTLLGRR